MFINCMTLFIWIYIAFLFFTKRARFVKWYISMLAFGIFFIILDAVLVGALLDLDQSTFDEDVQKELMRSVIGACIWVPYMLRSKRVQATFVN